jgi:hypothetical protein
MVLVFQFKGEVPDPADQVRGMSLR